MNGKDQMRDMSKTDDLLMWGMLMMLVVVIGMFAAMLAVTVDKAVTGKDFALGYGKSPESAALHWSVYELTREETGHVPRIADWAMDQDPGLAGVDREWLIREIERRNRLQEINWSFQSHGEIQGRPEGRTRVTAVMSVDVPAAPPGKRAFTTRITVPFELLVTRHRILSAEPEFRSAAVRTAGPEPAR